MKPAILRTERLELRPFTADAIDALLAGDEPRLARITSAVFPTPLRPPPLMEDVLPMIRDRLRADPAQEGWWSWIVILAEGRTVVGSLGFGGPPDPEGALVMGYATYPKAEGKGFATEAVAALIEWALAQPEVSKVCATIPPWNTASIRVAEKVGMRVVATVWEEDVDDVLLYAIEGPSAARPSSGSA